MPFIVRASPPGNPASGALRTGKLQDLLMMETTSTSSPFTFHTAPRCDRYLNRPNADICVVPIRFRARRAATFPLFTSHHPKRQQPRFQPAVASEPEYQRTLIEALSHLPERDANLSAQEPWGRDEDEQLFETVLSEAARQRGESLMLTAERCAASGRQHAARELMAAAHRVSADSLREAASEHLDSILRAIDQKEAWRRVADKVRASANRVVGLPGHLTLLGGPACQSCPRVTSAGAAAGRRPPATAGAHCDKCDHFRPFSPCVIRDVAPPADGHAVCELLQDAMAQHQARSAPDSSGRAKQRPGEEARQEGALRVRQAAAVSGASSEQACSAPAAPRWLMNGT